MNLSLRTIVFVSCAAVLHFGAPLSADAKVTVGTGQIEIPTYGWAAVRHPYFRGTDNVNIYPYRMLDFLSREKTNRVYRTVVLENEFLKITFLPELGGKIHEVIDKTNGEPMFYVNHVIKPGLIGQCGAWTSGGVEWNTGPQGHTVSCMLLTDVRILPEEQDGSRSVAIGETERIYGTKWTVVVTLRPGRSFIEERIRIYNPTATPQPYYFWNCTAAPNTPGFRFIYPMTLGCDHGGEKFFQWPIDNGKDLTRGSNYIDAASIFAWHCDQNFFGSYNDDLDRGVVAFADHHQVPGKKAWTWGQGGFGKMHQMDLTDSDGPYNEVQTGPLLTQAQVGRLEPSEAVEWREWWYPVRGIGGFTFANKDVAVNAERAEGKIRLRILPTATRKEAQVRLASANQPKASGIQCKLSPTRPTVVELALGDGDKEARVEIVSEKEVLAQFAVPLELPKRTPPQSRPKATTATQIIEEAWQDLLFARYSEAEGNFRRALELDARSAEAETGLALLKSTGEPDSATKHARNVLEVAPGSGLAHLTLANLVRQDDEAALDHAWKASTEPMTAAAGRALAGAILLARHDWIGAVNTSSGTGPWESDPACRNRLAFGRLMLGHKQAAAQLAQANLRTDPLDYFALAVLWAGGDKAAARELLAHLRDQPQAVLELAAEFVRIGQQEWALKVVQDFYLKPTPAREREPLLSYWAASLARQTPKSGSHTPNVISPSVSSTMLLPWRVEDLQVLEDSLRQDPSDRVARLLLGDVAFHLGREAEARKHWEAAAASGPFAALAARALGQAARVGRKDLATARDWLERANRHDPEDPIVARDLARVLFEMADKSEASSKDELVGQACERLKSAYADGKGRSDFVALLARAYNRRGQFEETARLLDTVRVTVWEGAREVHDLFEEAHLTLGESHLREGKPAVALAEFDRALEYPENLATGKLENAREAHIHFLRGKALQALNRTEDAANAWKRAAQETGGDKRQEEARQKAREALSQLAR